MFLERKVSKLAFNPPTFKQLLISNTRKVIVMRGGLSDPNTMKKEDEFKASGMLMESALNGDKQAVIRGIVLLQV